MASIGACHYSIPSLVYPQVGGLGSAMTCQAGIPSLDIVPLGWVAPWENPQMMEVEEERGMMPWSCVGHAKPRRSQGTHFPQIKCLAHTQYLKLLTGLIHTFDRIQ